MNSHYDILQRTLFVLYSFLWNIHTFENALEIL